MHRRKMRVIALVAVLALVAAGCGDDDDTTSGPTDTETDGGEGGAITVTIGTDSIEAPAEIEAGAVEVNIEGEVSDFSEVNFSRVEPGMSEEDFREGLAAVTQGGEFPDGFLNNAGAVTGPDPIVVLLEPGEYYVWTEDPEDDGGEEGAAEEGAEEAPPEGEAEGEAGAEGEGGGEGGEDGGPASFFVTSATVTGEADGELPDTEGTITARDYAFDIDVVAGSDATFTFRNEGPEQFHHAVVFNFGDIEPSVVEENLPAFMASEEEGPPPPPFEDLDFENFEAGGSGVFGPDGAGTFAATFEAGNTYAAVCFISDRSGGAPHVIAHDMFEVFTVE